MINENTEDLAKYEKMMEKRSPKSFAFAMQRTLTTLAEASRQNAHTQGTSELTKRSRYINKTIQYKKAQGTNVDRMESQFGQLAEAFGKKAGQLSVHETGGTIRAKRRDAVLRKGTAYARGGNLRKPVRKAMAKSEWMTAKRFYKGADKSFMPKTERGQMIGMIAWAKRTNYQGLIAGKSPQKQTQGVFKVTKNGFKMVYNLEHDSTDVKKLGWLEKSYTQPVQRRARIYKYELDKEITRLKRIYNL